jgi:UDP:flavonoid glycosyltransferase YjiC (YdhE family)
MKRIVFATWGSYGDLHPYMALALELQNRGHHSVIATSPIYREKIEAAGLEFAPVRPDLPEPDSPEAAEIIKGVSHSIKGPAYLFEKLLMPPLEATYNDTLAAVKYHGGADLIVAHQVPLVSPIVAEVTGLPRVSCLLFPISFASVYDPPTPPQFPFMRSVVTLHPLIGKVLMSIGKSWMLPWVRPVQDLRRKLGLGASPHPIFEGQHSPLLVLGLFSKLLGQVQPDFPANTRITGFPFYDEDQQLPPELENFLDAGEPPIVFTLGSSLVWSAGDFYRTSMEAAAKLGRRALLLVGDMRNVPDAALSDQIFAIEYAPHQLVMPRAGAIVHQGGIGTTAQALRAGKPTLIVPHGQDQPDNARRCKDLGVARVLPPSQYKAERVIMELSQLLENKEYAQHAVSAAREIRQESGTLTACDAIEEILNKGGNKL